MTICKLQKCVGAFGLLALTFGHAVAATSISREGINFQVIGNARNRAIRPDESGPLRVGRGSVSYEYGLSTTELTVNEYYKFVEAYGNTTGYPEGSLLSKGIYLTSETTSGYGINPQLAQHAATLTWRNAARFCNWLHNGRVNEAWAFERGAYDVSTFTSNPNGTLNDQVTRMQGAKFWIPSLDEWLKGVYFDPNRYGVGQEGYWQRPGARNDYLITGEPNLGGETDVRWNPDDSVVPLVPVGSYAQISGPWGLLDTSGGEREWSEEFSAGTARIALGSKRNDAFWYLSDDIAWQGVTVHPEISFAGFRIATEVPSPSGALVFAGLFLCRRNRRCDLTQFPLTHSDHPQRRASNCSGLRYPSAA